MKKVILVLAFVSLGKFAMAQKVDEANVPAATKNEFASLYPNTKAHDWEKEDNGYKACFMKDKKEMRVNISSTGALIDTETKIGESELPQPAKEYIKNNYAGKMVHKACKSVDASGKTTYGAKVSDMKVTFDSNGSYLRSEKEMKKS